MVVPPRFRIDPLTAVVLLHNVIHCEDAENDADRTVDDLTNEINNYQMSLSKEVLESALYACNMSDEFGKGFWHPWKWNFDQFVKHCLKGQEFHFDKYYNQIYAKKKEKESAQGARVDNDPSSNRKHLREARSEKK